MVTITDYRTRRRLQNRIAQQKFRERSKKLNHSKTIQHQDPSSLCILNCSPGAQMGYYSEVSGAETWIQTAVPSLSSVPINSHLFSHQNSTLDTIPGELYTSQHGEARLSNPPLPEMPFYSDPQGTNGLLGLDSTLAELSGGSGQRLEPSFEQGTPNTVSNTLFHTPESLLDDNHDSIPFQLTDDEFSPNVMKDRALLVLQKQKLHFRKQAQELMCGLISTYELGVSLEIFPCDPHLKQLLETADTIFSSKWK